MNDYIFYGISARIDLLYRDKAFLVVNQDSITFISEFYDPDFRSENRYYWYYDKYTLSIGKSYYTNLIHLFNWQFLEKCNLGTGLSKALNYANTIGSKGMDDTPFYISEVKEHLKYLSFL